MATLRKYYVIILVQALSCRHNGIHAKVTRTYPFYLGHKLVFNILLDPAQHKWFQDLMQTRNLHK